jgi:hypothetical protein
MAWSWLGDGRTAALLALLFVALVVLPPLARSFAPPAGLTAARPLLRALELPMR